MTERRLISQCKITILKVGAVGGTVSALISDVFKPLANFTLHFLIGLSIVLFFMIFIYILDKKNVVWARKLNVTLEEITDNYWFNVIFVTTLIVMIIFLAMFLLNNDKENGYLSERNRVVRVFQEDIGLVKTHLAQIVDNTKEMVGEQKKTNVILSEIVHPKDPRKALAQLGISFNVHGFRRAVTDGNVDQVRLFLEGGMDPYSEDKMWFPNMPVLVDAVINQFPNYVEIISLAKLISNYDPNKVFLLSNNTWDTLNHIVNNKITENISGNINSLWLSSFGFDDMNIKTKDNYTTLGYLIPLFILSPDKKIVDFIKEFNINIKSGVKMRSRICEYYDLNLVSYLKSKEKMMSYHIDNYNKFYFDEALKITSNNLNKYKNETNVFEELIK